MSELQVTLERIHSQRMREVSRSADWPYQDVVEIDLMVAGLLERVTPDSGPLWCGSPMLVLGIWPVPRKEITRHVRRMRRLWTRWSLLREGRIA